MRLRKHYSDKPDRKEKNILELEGRQKKEECDRVGQNRTPPAGSRSLHPKLKLVSCCQEIQRTLVKEERRSKTKMVPAFEGGGIKTERTETRRQKTQQCN